MSDAVEVDRPLAGLRVVDAVTGPLAPITRYLAELGATVVRIVEPEPDADPFEELAANHAKQALGFGATDSRALADLR